MKARPFAFSVHDIVAALGGQVTGPKKCSIPGPGHSDKDRSLSITVDLTAPDGFICHSFAAGDDDLVCKDYIKRRLGLADRELKCKNGSHKEYNKTKRRQGSDASESSGTDEYIYRQADGTPYLKVFRTGNKQFFQSHWNGVKWIKGAPPGAKIPYRLPELENAEHDDVFIVEGEKDCETLARYELIATTNSCGAGNWTSDLNRYFAGKNVYILPDNDEVGVHHARDVALNLMPIAREVRVVELPGLPPKGDVSDWLAAGGAFDALIDLARHTIPLKAEDFGSSNQQNTTSEEANVPLVLTLTQWRNRDLRAPDHLLGDVFSTTSRGILSAPTGLGKSNIAIAIGMRIAAGTGFLHWEGRRAAKVLYIDGEMSRRLLKQRLAAEEIRLINETSENLRDGINFTGFYALNTEDLPNFQPLNTELGQAAIEQIIEGIGGCDFVIFDNVMSLTSGSMVDEEAWSQMLPWLRSLSKRGIGQLWVHHTGHDETKGYGTKTREWQMDVVIHLTKVERADTDVAFKLEFRKARERTPDNREDFQPVNIFLVDDKWESDAASTSQRAKKLSPTGAKYFEALQNVVAGGQLPKSKPMHGCHAVHRDDWKNECELLGLLDPKGQQNSQRAKFSKYRTELVSANMVACENDHTWIR